MIDRKTLDLARSFAKAVAANTNGYDTKVHAAALVIHLLPDEWVAAEELREVVADHHIDMSEALMEALGALLPDPPAPRTMAEIEWDDAEHRLAGATAAWTEGDTSTVVMLNKSGKKITVYDSASQYSVVRELNPGILTPTGRKYRLEPEDDTPVNVKNTENCEIDPADPDPILRHAEETENRPPRPEDVPVGEAWQVEVEGKEAIGYRNDPGDKIPWVVVYRGSPNFDYLYDTDVTLVARLVPEQEEA